MVGNPVQWRSIVECMWCPGLNLQYQKIWRGVGGWRDGSAVTSTWCSCRECRFDSQHPHGGSTISNSRSRGPNVLFMLPRTLHTHGTLHTHLNTHTHISKYIKKSFLMVKGNLRQKELPYWLAGRRSKKAGLTDITPLGVGPSGAQEWH